MSELLIIDLFRSLVRAQSEALKNCFDNLGIEYTRENVDRVSKIEETEGQFRGGFVLDMGEPSERVLFWYKGGTIDDPKIRFWFPTGTVVTGAGFNRTGKFWSDQTLLKLDTVDNTIRLAANIVGAMNTRKVFFVGMHNKPGFEPLDSRTYSGKIIDAAALQIEGPVIKTNLADNDFLPKEPVIQAMDWHRRNQVLPGDIIFLLGRWVQKNFIRLYNFVQYHEIEHPAAFSVRRNRLSYIEKITHLCEWSNR